MKFTLIEILVTIAIIAILFAISVAGYSIAMQKSAESQTIAIIEQIKTGMTSYKDDTGYFIQNPDSDVSFLLDVPDAPEMGADATDDIDNDGDGNIDIDGVASNPNINPDLGIDFQDYVNIKDSNLDNDRYVLDAWGSKLRYQCPGTHNRTGFDILSAGPDGDYTTTNDNINNWR